MPTSDFTDPTAPARENYTLGETTNSGVTTLQLTVAASAPITTNFIGVTTPADATQSANWSSGVPGISGDVVTFNNSDSITGPITVNLNGSPHYGSLTFNNTGSDTFTIAAGSGGPLYLDNTYYSTSATVSNLKNNNTISTPIVLLSNTTISAAVGTSLTLSGAISGVESVTVPSTSAGQITFSAANSFSGSMSVGGGSVSMTAANSFSGGLTVTGGSVLLSGADTYTGGVALSNGALDLNSTTALGAASNTFTLTGGTIDNTSSGPITLANNNPITIGGSFVYGGTQNLNLGAGAVSLAAPGASSITLGGSGSTLTLGGSMANTSGGSQTIAVLGAGNTLSLPGTLTLSGASAATVDLTGSSNITLGAVANGTSGSTLAYSGTGALTITGNEGASFLNAGSGVVTVDNGSPQSGVYIINGKLNFAGSFSGGSSSASWVGTGTVLIPGGQFGGSQQYVNLNAGAVMQIGGGFQASSGYGGQWANNMASLVIPSGQTFDIKENGVNFNALVSTSSTATIQNGYNNGSLAIGVANGSGTYAGVLSDDSAWALAKLGTGTEILPNNNTVSGGVTVSGGGALIGTTSVASGTPFGSSPLTVVGATFGVTPNVAAGSGTALSLTGASGGTFAYGGGAVLAVNKGNETSLSFVVGSSSASSAVFTRTGTGTLVIATGSGTANLGTSAGETVTLSSTNSGAAPTLTNGIVNTSMVAANNGPAQSGDFLTFASTTTGFQVASYSGSLGSSTNTSVVSNTADTTLSSGGAAFALRDTATIAVPTGQTLALGNGAGQAGLILNGGAITGAGTLDFGAAEGTVYTSLAGGVISTAITGSGGLTTFGPGELMLTGATSFTGGLNINQGIVNVGSSAELGAHAINMNGGTLQFGAPMSLTNTIALGAGGGTFDTAGNSVTLSGPITGTSSGSEFANLFKVGAGTLTLNSTTSYAYTGNTEVFRGTLVLDQNVGAATNIINQASNLFLGGGALVQTGSTTGGSSQIFTSLTVAPGASSIDVNSNGGTGTSLQLGVIKNNNTQTNGFAGVNTGGGIGRNVGGALDITLPTTGSVTTTSANTAGSILGGWATVNGGTGWATSAATGAALGAITALPSLSLTNDTWAVGNNTTVTLANNTIASGSATNSLEFNRSSVAATVTLSGTNIIQSGGILVTPSVGANLETITGGTITSGEPASISSIVTSDIIVNQYNTGAGLTIQSTIADNGGSSALTKSGPGLLTLTGANTYTGPTYINAGTLNVGSAETAGTSGPLGNSAASNPGSIVFGGGALQYSAANNFDYSGRFSAAANQPISIDTNGQSVTFASALTSVGGTLAVVDAVGAITPGSGGGAHAHRRQHLHRRHLGRRGWHALRQRHELQRGRDRRGQWRFARRRGHDRSGRYQRRRDGELRRDLHSRLQPVQWLDPKPAHGRRHRRWQFRRHSRAGSGFRREPFERHRRRGLVAWAVGQQSQGRLFGGDLGCRESRRAGWKRRRGNAQSDRRQRSGAHRGAESELSRDRSHDDQRHIQPDDYRLAGEHDRHGVLWSGPLRPRRRCGGDAERRARAEFPGALRSRLRGAVVGISPPQDIARRGVRIARNAIKRWLCRVLQAIGG